MPKSPDLSHHEFVPDSHLLSRREFLKLVALGFIGGTGTAAAMGVGASAAANDKKVLPPLLPKNPNEQAAKPASPERRLRVASFEAISPENMNTISPRVVNLSSGQSIDGEVGIFFLGQNGEERSKLYLRRIKASPGTNQLDTKSPIQQLPTSYLDKNPVKDLGKPQYNGTDVLLPFYHWEGIAVAVLQPQTNEVEVIKLPPASKDSLYTGIQTVWLDERRFLLSWSEIRFSNADAKARIVNRLRAESKLSWSAPIIDSVSSKVFAQIYDGFHPADKPLVIAESAVGGQMPYGTYLVQELRTARSGNTVVMLDKQLTTEETITEAKVLQFSGNLRVSDSRSLLRLTPALTGYEDSPGLDYPAIYENQGQVVVVRGSVDYTDEQNHIVDKSFQIDEHGRIVASDGLKPDHELLVTPIRFLDPIVAILGILGISTSRDFLLYPIQNGRARLDPTQVGQLGDSQLLPLGQDGGLLIGTKLKPGKVPHPFQQTVATVVY